MAETTFTDKTIVRIRSIDHNNFFDYLSSAYEVLRKIFSYLSLEELEVVSEAIEKWRPIVETTKNERTTIDSFVISSKLEDYKMWSEANFTITFGMIEDRLIEEKLSKHLKKNAQFVMVQSRAGVIGTTCDLSKLVQQKMLRYSCAMATHVRIPEFPDVGIKIFTWKRSMSFKAFRDSFSIPDNKVIKCLLILMIYNDEDRDTYKQKDDFVLHLQSTQAEEFAVGGCIIDSFLDDEKAVSKYIVFYGDKVEAASVILNHKLFQKQMVYSKIEELKSECSKMAKGVVFVFRCCNRDQIIRQQKVKKNLIEWEGDALRKYFRKTPIVGCYGYGEFGKNFPDHESRKCKNKKARESDVWEYSFSTSVVYVGFKK